MPMPSCKTGFVYAIWRRAVHGLLLAGVGCLFAACSLFDASPEYVQRFSDGVAGDSQRRTVNDARALMSEHGLARPEPKPTPVSPPAEVPSLADLVGGAPSDIRAVLGEPGMRERTRTAQRWRYDGAGCAVDLLFFFDVASDRYRLAMMSSNGEPVDVDSAARCLAGPSVATVRS